MELTAERKKVNKDITQTIRIIISAMRRSLEISLGQVMMESESKHIYVLPVPKGLNMPVYYINISLLVLFFLFVYL
jgi:hypothetical protein